MNAIEKIQEILNELPGIGNEYYDAVLNEKEDATALKYLRSINSFYNYCCNRGVSFSCPSSSEIDEYFSTLEVGNSEKGTIWSAFNSFYNYCVDSNYIDKNPMNKVKRAKITSFSTGTSKFITCELLYDISYEMYNSNKIWHKRDLAIFLLIATRGIKTGTIPSLNVDDYNEITGELTIGCDKVVLFNNAKDAFDEWFYERKEKYSYVNDNALFISSVKERITETGLRKLLSNYMPNKSRLKITVEDVRKTIAKGLLNIGCPIRSVQEYLQHSDSRHTYAFLDAVQNCDANVADSDEENILQLFGCSNKDILFSKLANVTVNDDNEELWSTSGDTGTNIHRLTANSLEKGCFDNWFNKDKVDMYCKIKTMTKDLVWFDFESFEVSGYCFSPIVLGEKYDVAQLENKKIYVAPFDVSAFLEVDGLDTQIQENTQFFFFYVSGKINGEKVGALRVLAREIEKGDVLTAFPECLCEITNSSVYDERIDENILYYENKLEEISFDDLDKEIALCVNHYACARLNLFEFLKSFTGIDAIESILVEDINKTKEIISNLSSFIINDTVSSLSNILNNLTDLNEEENIEEDLFIDENEYSFANVDFEDVTIFEEDDITVDFAGFDVEDDTVFLKIWCKNESDRDVNLWLKDIKIDGDDVSDYEKIFMCSSNGKWTSGTFLLESVDTDVYYDVEFTVEINDINDNALYLSQRVKAHLDFIDAILSIETK